MGARIQAAFAFLDRFLPPSALHDEEEKRKARLMLAVAAIMTSQIPIFAGLYLSFGVYDLVALLLFTGVLYTGTPWVMRRSVSLGGHYVLGILASVLWAIGVFAGGPQSPAIWWTVALPVIAMLALGKRPALLWMGIASGSAMLFDVLGLLGVEFPTRLSPEQAKQIGMTAIPTLAFVLYALASTYESTRGKMMQALDRAGDDMRLVLNNIEQGFVTITRGGEMSGMRSAVVSRWFGEPRPGERFHDWLGRAHAKTGDWLRMGFDDLFEGIMPHEVTLDQMPARFSVDDRHYGLAYRPILNAAGEVNALVVIVSDDTEKVHAERAEAAQRELVAIVTHLARDRAGVLQFFDEASSLIERLQPGESSALRILHTLKGNAGIFGLRSVADRCHALESIAQEEGRQPGRDEIEELRNAWDAATALVSPLLQRKDGERVISELDLSALEKAVQEGKPANVLLGMVQALRHEKASQVFGRLAEQARALSQRLGRSEPSIHIQDAGVRLDPARWASVWAALVHAVRNAVDHGGETPDVRKSQGKSPALRLEFACTAEDGGTRLVLRDDGAGVDWERVREKAATKGLPHQSQDDLYEALFSDGFSTRTEVSDISGRGVGLGALREACREIGARLDLRSTPGKGTELSIWAPHVTRARAA